MISPLKCLVVVMLLVAPWGCTPSATPALAVDPLDRTMSRLEDPRARQQFADVMATPEMQRAMGEMSSGVVRGVALGLSNDEIAAQLADVSRRMTAAMAESLAQRMERDVAPAGAAMANAAVEAAMRAAVRTAATEIPATLAPAMRQALTDAIGPAMEAVLRDNVGRGVVALASSPDLQVALGATGRAMAREVVLGANEAMAELEDRDGKRGLLARVAKFVAGMSLIGWLVALAVVGAGGWLLVRGVKSRARLRGAAREREVREAVLLTLATTLRAAEGRPWADDLRDALRNTADGGAAAWSDPRVSGRARNAVRQDDRGSQS